MPRPSGDAGVEGCAGRLDGVHVVVRPGTDGIDLALHALQAGDIHALRSSFSPDATWTLRGGVVFHVVDGRIAGVTEYVDTAYMKEVLFSD